MKHHITRLLAAILALCCLFGSIGTGLAADAATTLTMWAPLNDNTAMSLTSNAELASIKQTEAATGIHIEWTEPPVGEETSQFNLMIASQELPDMIAWFWQSYPGGPEKAIADGVLMDLTPYLDQMPNLKAFYDKYPELLKQCTTDEGHIYFFPRINGDALDPAYKNQSYWMGPVYRKDILDALNLTEPQTIDDWYNVLTAVKQAYPDMIPLSAAGGTTAETSLYNLAAIFGVRPDLYMDGGKVNFGLLSPKFKTFVETMAKWYQEGLIDPDFIANMESDLKSKTTSGQVFSFFGTQGGGYVGFSQIMETGLPEAKLAIAPWPTGPDGKAYSAQVGVTNTINRGFGIGITTACKDVEAALKYLDFGYSPEGIMINNFGVEGETYTVDAQGNVQWTPETAAEMAATSVDHVLGRYLLVGISVWASYCDPRTFALMRTYPGQYEAGEIWGRASGELDMPPLTPTTEESGEVATIMNNVTTYRDEMIGNMIMGRADIATYDTIVEEAKKMKIEEAVAIYNAALERYNAR